jgi:hypothetical protein
MTTPALAETVKGKGRHYRHPVTGDLVPSVTNVLSILNKPALVGWAAKQVATMAADMREVLPSMKHDECVDLLKGAASRTSNRAGSRGTDVHEWVAQRLLGGPPPTLTGQAHEYQAAAENWLDETKPEPITVETSMFHALYAGTCDAVVSMNGERWLLDFKTSSGIYGEAALQTAALSRCFLWHHEGSVIEAQPVDRVGVVRFAPNGKWEMKEVKEPEAHFSAFLSLIDVWHWQHDTDKWEAK